MDTLELHWLAVPSVTTVYWVLTTVIRSLGCVRALDLDCLNARCLLILLIQTSNVVYRGFVVQCKPGYGGTGVFCALDSDQDGIPDNAISGCSDPLCKKVSPVPSVTCTLHKTFQPSYVLGQLPYDTK